VDSNGISCPFVVLQVGENRVQTRTIFDTLNPFWAEEYHLDVMNPNREVLRVVVHDFNQPNNEFGIVEIPLYSLKDEETHEAWYPLHLKSAPKSKENEGKETKETKEGEATEQSPPEDGFGEIRLKLKYNEEIVFPAPIYDEMLALIVNPPFSIVTLVGRICDDREIVANNLIRIFEEKNLSISLIKNLIDQELLEQDNHTAAFIFRGDSFCTKMIELYMKFVGQSYLVNTLHPIISKVYSSKKSCEIDPTKVTKPSKILKNSKRLEKFIIQTLELIFQSVDKCPSGIREILRYLQSKVIERLPPEEIEPVKYSIVSSFVFLRFFCPAIMGPKLNHIMDEHPPDVISTRTLILIAKSVQAVSNFKEFTGNDEGYMKHLNAAITDNITPMRSLINKISSVNEISPPQQRPPIHMEKELATAHRTLKKLQTRIVANQQTQEYVAVRKLTAVLENLEYIGQHEKLAEYP